MRVGGHNRGLRTFSPAPVAPSISSITMSTGFVLPTAEPDSRAGRILSSTTDPVRASLLMMNQMLYACSNWSDLPSIDFHYFIARLTGNDMS